MAVRRPVGRVSPVARAYSTAGTRVGAGTGAGRRPVAQVLVGWSPVRLTTSAAAAMAAREDYQLQPDTGIADQVLIDLIGDSAGQWRWRWDLNPRRLAPHTLSR